MKKNEGQRFRHIEEGEVSAVKVVTAVVASW